MSGLQLECCELRRNIGHEIGDQKIEPKLLKSEPLSQGQTIASEIMHEIVDNALNTVSKKEDELYKRLQISGDIKDEYTPRSANLTDLSDMSCKFEKDKSGDDEIKKFNTGVGDQLCENEIIESKATCAYHHMKSIVLEKKSRLTDLVKNSKNLIAKLLVSEAAKVKENEWEEKEETQIRSVELDCVKPDDQPFISNKGIHPENIPLPKSNSDEIIKVPDDSNMDNVSLAGIQDEDDLLNQETEELDEIARKSMTFSLPASSKGDDPGRRTLRAKVYNLKKKKWNIGSKIVNYIRKHSTKKESSEEPENLS